jgi:hypothetical protein
MTIAAAFAERYPFLNDLFTRRIGLVATAFAALILSVNLSMFAHAAATSKDYVTRYGPVIGGDFVVFDTAASAAAAGEAAELYEAGNFSLRLAEAFPARGAVRLSWQYPPTMLLAVAPLAVAPYLASYALFAAATAGLLFAALRGLWSDRRALFFVAASPAAFQSLITGQTGFLTAALLATAGAFASRRPVLAGVAAGVLTIKPQLGLLIPLAFAAAGCWRAFAVAAATAVLLALASAAAFGAESWSAFLAAVGAHGDRMQTTVFPFHKLMTPYGGAMMIGAPNAAALAAQVGCSLGAAAAVALVWRRIKDWDLRTAILCAAAPLMTPYAFYYEIAILIPPALILARRGFEQGWLKGERTGLALLWAAPMALPGASHIPGLPLSFLTAAAMFALVLRRAFATAAR